jgi:fused signal recognition particle receptor
VDYLPLILVVVALAALAGWWLWRRRRPPEAGPAPSAVAPTSPRGLAKPRRAFAEALRGVLGRDRVDEDFWQQLEEVLIQVDVGVSAATGVVERIRRRGLSDPAGARRMLGEELRMMLDGRPRALAIEGDPAVILVVGVNGSGKTTTIAKLAARLQEEGRRPLLGAADTFRAAADSQLREWSQRVGAPVISGAPGADPASVAHDALTAAKARGFDVLIVDTAGRLHSKRDLMNELSKIRRVLERDGGRVSEVLLVLDATAGQNGLAQAREFTASVGVTGIVLTKLDSTSRGGIVVAVEQDLGIPVKLIGVGEGAGDLVDFDPDLFVSELLEEP